MTRKELIADISECYRLLNGCEPKKREVEYWQELPDLYLKSARNTWRKRVLDQQESPR